MEYNDDGYLPVLTVLLISILVAVSVFGFIILISNWDTRVSFFKTDPVNYTGIDYTSVGFNATNSTVHGLTKIAPGFIWFILIFVATAFLILLGLALKGH